jgi:hypothetical protein
MMPLGRVERLQIMVTEEELVAIDDWRFERQMPSRAAAIRELLLRGLSADGFALADRSVKSKNFGIVSKQKSKRIGGLNGATSPRLDATQSVRRVEDGVRRPTPSGRSSETA